MTDATLRNELNVASLLALEAGKRILRHLQGQIEVGYKERGEVVTAADREANHIIREGLSTAFPADAIYSEETADSPQRLSNSRVWIVDPLDGTSNFIARGDEFSISIGLSVNGKAVLGVIYNPTRDELFVGGVGLGVSRNGIAVSVTETGDISQAQISVSRKEQAEFGKLNPDLKLVPITSMAYKLARVAAGLEDGALSMKRRKEWGSCAGVALVLAAGGKATLLDGSDIRFNKAEQKQPLGMLAAGANLHPPLLHALKHLLDETQGTPG